MVHVSCSKQTCRMNLWMKIRRYVFNVTTQPAGIHEWITSIPFHSCAKTGGDDENRKGGRTTLISKISSSFFRGKTNIWSDKETVIMSCVATFIVQQNNQHLKIITFWHRPHLNIYQDVTLSTSFSSWYPLCVFMFYMGLTNI